jgi:hypothetical protein
MTSTTADPYRRTEVATLSARDELLIVVRVALAIAIAVWVYLGSHAFEQGNARRDLLPFQKLIADRPPHEQRMFRELQEGLLEAERLRSTGGRWPTVETLAADGIPPFALDPTQRVRYNWRLIVDGTFINYLGLPAAGDAPAWLVLIREPEPGAPPDPALADEEHHQLVNGPKIHVSTWALQNPTKLAASIVRIPQAEGWMQLYAIGPGL